MAKINNSDVIQKLIDQLDLSPAKDVIPTELAEKILPVFQINSADVNVQMKPNYFLWQDATDNDADKTLTVPDGHTYVVKWGFVDYTCSADAGSRIPKLEIKDGSGNILWDVYFAIEMAANDTEFFRISSLGDKSIAGIQDNTTVPIPHEFALKEGWTLQIVDTEGTALAADDMHISFVVDDQED